MKLLLDTHLLIWYAAGSSRVTPVARHIMDDPNNDLIYSVASLWELVIKQGHSRDGFQIEPVALRKGLIENRYGELAITADHAFAVRSLPPIHKDPFDRILIAQAMTEGLTLVTADAIIAQYPGAIRLV